MASSLVDLEMAGGKIIPLQIITKTHSSQDELVGNVRVNLARPIQRFLGLPGLLAQRGEPLAIVGGGPSLSANLDKLRSFKQIMVVGSAHDHLVSLGIIPSFALAVDAKDDAVDYFRHPQDKTSYLLASQCHPNLFDKLKDHKIAMWHFKGQLDDEEKHFHGEQTISWGCMVGVMSIQIALFLGFQELHFFGFDCSFIEDEHHSYPVGPYADSIEAEQATFKVNGREFQSTTGLVSQVENIFDVFASPGGQFLKGYVYGEGLLAHVIKASPPEMSRWLEAV